ncbi:DUF309 domain-containing protein [Paenibacillus senegalensis]|uniref:DUF309 domain-containing protein n=1 Tax=Paenibacillus senegalensis TaxID=1465766 RepID=UPI000287E8B6|nr:DUF309 domain-containing protein [Paenibacillus senegalensis]
MNEDDIAQLIGRMSYDMPYIEYLVFFHADRDYFECHEIMEEHWKACPASPLRQAWLGLIQVAVAQYHERRNNLKGALIMLTSAIGHLQQIRVEEIGLDSAELMFRLEERKQQLEHRLAGTDEDGGAKRLSLEGVPFTDLNLPICDQRLEQACVELCQQRGRVWLKASDLSNEYLVHKHSLRDRSEVVSERRRRLREKQLKRQR